MNWVANKGGTKELFTKEKTRNNIFVGWKIFGRGRKGERFSSYILPLHSMEDVEDPRDRLPYWCLT